MSGETQGVHFDFGSPATDRDDTQVARIAQEVVASSLWHPMLPGGLQMPFGQARRCGASLLGC
jgi:2-hydroxychromene-2-carboxylate isomerase